MFEFENFTVTSRLRDGEYIKYKSAIPSEYNIEIKAEVASFCDAIDRASLIINTESAKSPLKLDIKDDTITMSCSSHMGKVSDILNVDSSGGELLIGFNHKYLWDAAQKLWLWRSKNEVYYRTISADYYAFRGWRIFIYDSSDYYSGIEQEKYNKGMVRRYGKNRASNHNWIYQIRPIIKGFPGIAGKRGGRKGYDIRRNGVL